MLFRSSGSQKFTKHWVLPKIQGGIKRYRKKVLLIGLTLLHSNYGKSEINLVDDYEQCSPSFVMNNRPKKISKLHAYNVKYQRSVETNFSIITQKMRCYEKYSMWDCCADLAFIFTILLSNLIHSAKFIISLLNPNCSKQFNGD